MELSWFRMAPGPVPLANAVANVQVAPAAGPVRVSATPKPTMRFTFENVTGAGGTIAVGDAAVAELKF